MEVEGEGRGWRRDGSGLGTLNGDSDRMRRDAASGGASFDFGQGGISWVNEDDSYVGKYKKIKVSGKEELSREHGARRDRSDGDSRPVFTRASLRGPRLRRVPHHPVSRRSQYGAGLAPLVFHPRCRFPRFEGRIRRRQRELDVKRNKTSFYCNAPADRPVPGTTQVPRVSRTLHRPGTCLLSDFLVPSSERRFRPFCM